ncbi:MAG TPA: DUF6064 family protein [Burkholderiaceae bacterium]|nr:DUF6064 family protein [Burkholderiaceae bacterium]
MSEWWTYTPSDFLLFSARTYYRLFELYNRDVWPAQLVALALGFVILACLFSNAAWRGKVVTAILAACWLWVAWAFHAERYATINWAAHYFAIGFAVEALLLLWFGVVRTGMACTPASTPPPIAGISLFLYALIVQPLIGPMLGRPWLQLELFGMVPDPTAVATLGILLVSGRRPPWLLMVIPIVWCIISGATLWSMGSKDAGVMPVIALLVVVLLAIRKVLARRSD